MKKVAIIAAVVLVASLSAFQVSAQKIGYVNMQEIIVNMPEFAKADTALNKYRQELFAEIQSMRTDLQDNISSFVKDSTTMSDAVKEVKRDELQDAQQRLMTFQQSSQQKVGQKQNELMKPIIDKAQKAVEAVADSKGYTWVFNDTGNGNILLVKPSGDNLTTAVKANLGID